MFEKAKEYKTRKVIAFKEGVRKQRAKIAGASLVMLTMVSSASANSSVNFTKIIDLMEEMPAVIAPIADIIAEMIVIMAYLAVAGLIIGIFGGIVSWINNSFGGFKFK